MDSRELDRDKSVVVPEARPSGVQFKEHSQGRQFVESGEHQVAEINPIRLNELALNTADDIKAVMSWGTNNVAKNAPLTAEMLLNGSLSLIGSIVESHLKESAPGALAQNPNLVTEVINEAIRLVNQS